MNRATHPHPDWNHLYEIASSQDGHFTTQQAEQAGYSRPLLAKYLASGRVTRVRRGVYRLVHYPPQEHEQLVVLWLWSGQEGVFSHETALALHELSDALPSRVYMTLPTSWKTRRLLVPEELALCFQDIPAEERRWFGAVPLTSVARTLHDCASAAVSPELLLQARRQALQRGLLSKAQRTCVDEVLTQFASEKP